jgi:hypothetical protein
VGVAVAVLSDGDLLGLMTRLQEKSHKADMASAKWEKRKNYLDRYCRVNRYTEEQRRQKIAIDWDLNDAMAVWDWNRREANRLAQLILAEKALREMLNAE